MSSTPQTTLRHSWKSLAVSRQAIPLNPAQHQNRFQTLVVSVYIKDYSLAIVHYLNGLTRNFTLMEILRGAKKLMARFTMMACVSLFYFIFFFVQIKFVKIVQIPLGLTLIQQENKLLKL